MGTDFPDQTPGTCSPGQIMSTASRRQTIGTGYIVSVCFLKGGPPVSGHLGTGFLGPSPSSSVGAYVAKQKSVGF